MTETRPAPDDWIYHWNASIAVKISAVVLWLLVIVSIISISVVLSNLKEDLIKLQNSEADQLAYHVGIIASQSDHSKENLKKNFKKLINDFSFDAFDVALGNNVFKTGSFSKQIKQHVVRRISFHTEADKYRNTYGFGRAVITIYSKPINELLKDKRKNLIIIILLFLLPFSISLTWIINRIVTKPIKYLVEATQTISKGNMATRLELNRHDEFGQLAGFFNDMLDTIENKQTELQQAVNEAKLASIAKSNFLANMSHEIRTPLTAITGFSKTLLDENIPKELRIKAIQSITRNGTHLLTVINDILDVSKIEANKLDININQLSVFKLLMDVELLVKEQAINKGLNFNIDFNFPLPDMICSDEIRLKQILINLCSNAVKFTLSGAVSIDVFYIKADNKLLFKIKDTGIGIEEEQIKNIFKPFTQADSSTTRDFGGTGLGLSISYQLATLLGGSLSVTSQVDRGSCFALSIDPGEVSESDFVNSIPVKEIDENHKENKIVNSLSGRILLVEDTPDSQLLISYYLEDMGAEVTAVNNGQEAIDIINENGAYDLILMDMQMPVMGGVEAVKILRASGYTAPIAMLTANAMKQFENESIDAGCDDYLMKPIDVIVLQRTVEKYLLKKLIK